jgi:hypothetical protein
MELRLKKLRDDEERTKRRIESTKRKLQEAERIKEAKRQDEAAKTQNVMELIRIEEETRTWN